MKNDDVEKINEEYSKEYCLFLEVAYGNNLLSEGGEQAIENLLSRESLDNKKILDIGFGLGGVAFYLAEKYNVHVSGVEINPWLVEEACRRAPAKIEANVNFSHYHPDSELPFENAYFDIVFSKGVLTHLSSKKNLFQQVNRVLKRKGAFVIDDWLSPYKNKWGERLQKMCEIEGLTLHPESMESYIDLLESTSFTDIEVRDENANYYGYNLDVVAHLEKKRLEKSHGAAFESISIEEAIESYQLIADSIKDNELLIRWIRSVKA